jgi:hypothetical protein
VLRERFVSLRRCRRFLSYWVGPVQEAVPERVKSNDEQEQASGAHGDSIGLLVLCRRVGEFQVCHSRSDDQGHHNGVSHGLSESCQECVCVYYLLGHGDAFLCLFRSVLVRKGGRSSSIVISQFQRPFHGAVIARVVVDSFIYQLSTYPAQLIR